jgi:hypothetical protein
MKGIPMPRYDVTAWCSVAHYTTFEIEAASALEALAKAKMQVDNESAEPCDGAAYDWNEFELCSEGTDEYLRHLEPERAAEIASPDLLDTVKRGVAAARDVISKWEQGDLAHAVRTLALWLATAESAIEQLLKP